MATTTPNNKRFKLQGRKLFLTYPQCDTTKEAAMANTQAYLEDPKAVIIVGHEKHQDGGNHLHIYIEATNKLTITRANALDAITGQHGNYKTVGASIEDKIRVIRYVIKDGDYLEHNINATAAIKDMTTTSTRGRKSMNEGEAKIILDKIKQGADIKQLIVEHPHYLFTHNIRKVKEFIQEYQDATNAGDTDDLPETLYPWQEQLLQEVQQKPHPRKVIWYYDPQGNSGKSTMKALLVQKHNAFFATGKCADMYHAYNKQPIIIFDLSRTMEDHVNYTAMEDFKNGMIFSTKYESKAKVFKKPHLIVFSNFKPNMDALSKDRWDIRQLSSETPDEMEPMETTYFMEPSPPQDITVTAYMPTLVEENYPILTVEHTDYQGVSNIEWDFTEDAFLSNAGHTWKTLESIPAYLQPFVNKEIRERVQRTIDKRKKSLTQRKKPQWRRPAGRTDKTSSLTHSDRSRRPKGGESNARPTAEEAPDARTQVDACHIQPERSETKPIQQSNSKGVGASARMSPEGGKETA